MTSYNFNDKKPIKHLNKKLYDPNSALLIAHYESGNIEMPEWYMEELYLKRGANRNRAADQKEAFLYAKGNMKSKYVKLDEKTGELVGCDFIKPLSDEEASLWLFLHEREKCEKYDKWRRNRQDDITIYFNKIDEAYDDYESKYGTEAADAKFAFMYDKAWMNKTISLQGESKNLENETYYEWLRDKMTATHAVTVSLPDDVTQMLENAAYIEDKPISKIVCEAIRKEYGDYLFEIRRSCDFDNPTPPDAALPWIKDIDEKKSVLRGPGRPRKHKD